MGWLFCPWNYPGMTRLKWLSSSSSCSFEVNVSFNSSGYFKDCPLYLVFLISFQDLACDVSQFDLHFCCCCSFFWFKSLCKKSRKFYWFCRWDWGNYLRNLCKTVIQNYSEFKHTGFPNNYFPFHCTLPICLIGIIGNYYYSPRGTSYPEKFS